MGRKLLLVGILFLAPYVALATHIRGGEIHLNHIQGNTYQVVVSLYFDTHVGAGSIPTSIQYDDGAGTTHVVSMASSDTANTVVRAFYVDTLTYSGAGTYHLHVSNPNRVENICNIGSSIDIPFVTESMVVLSPFILPSNLPELTTDQRQVTIPTAGIYTIWGLFLMRIVFPTKF